MRWARLQIHVVAASAVLDFTDHDFVLCQSPAQIATTVSRCIRMHGTAPIDVLRVALSPFDALGQYALEWVVAALRRGAREVGVDGVDLARRCSVDNDDCGAS